MGKYIGFKLIEAEPMSKERFDSDVMDGSKKTEGYLVKYSDDYESWSPKDVFEKAYMKIGDNNTITQDNVENFIQKIDVQQMGDKTTIVQATLNNGFVIVDSSSCVDPNNFDMAIGIEICTNRIKNKVWELLGFLLQTAQKGIQKED